MPHSQPASNHPRTALTTAPDAIPANTHAPGFLDGDGATPTDVRVRETGTGPFRYVVVEVPAGVHPATLATALRSLPIACEFETMADMSGTHSGGELRFKVHDEPRKPSKPGSRVLRLADDSPFTEVLGSHGGHEDR